MNRLAAPEDVLRLLESVRPEITIANVFGEREEHLILIYALAAERVGSAKRFCWHSPSFAEASVDKVAFHRIAVSLALPVPDGGIASTPQEALRLVADLGGPPVVLKEAKTQARQGTHPVLTHDSLLLTLARADLAFPLVVQQMVTGEEVVIEVLTSPSGSCRFPLVSTGDLDSQCDPAARARAAPRALGQRCMRTVHDIIDTIERELRPCGPWQLDMAAVGQDMFVLEINGRLGGLADLGFWATGHDSHELFCRLLMGASLPQPVPVAAAMQIPVSPAVVLPESSQEVHVEILASSTFNPLPVDANYGRIALWSNNLNAVDELLGQLDPEMLRVPAITVRQQAHRAFVALGVIP